MGEFSVNKIRLLAFFLSPAWLKSHKGLRSLVRSKLRFGPMAPMLSKRLEGAFRYTAYNHRLFDVSGELNRL